MLHPARLRHGKTYIREKDYEDGSWMRVGQVSVEYQTLMSAVFNVRV